MHEQKPSLPVNPHEQLSSSSPSKFAANLSRLNAEAFETTLSVEDYVSPLTSEQVASYTSGKKLLQRHSIEQQGLSLSPETMKASDQAIELDFIQKRAGIDHLKRDFIGQLSDLGEQDKAVRLAEMYCTTELEIRNIYDSMLPDGKFAVPQTVVELKDQQSQALEELLRTTALHHPLAAAAIETGLTAAFMGSQDAKPEVKESQQLSLDEAVELLSYTDVVDASEQATYTEHTRQSPKGMQYAATLQKITEQYGLPEVRSRAEAMVTQCSRELSSLGLEPSIFSKSVSWFLWDLSKQTYLLNNPDEQDPRYTAADPMTSHEKMDEILDRHIGWEVYAKLGSMSDEELNDYLDTNTNKDAVLTLLHTTSKPNGTLPSLELAELGKLIKGNAGSREH